ncbi:MAG: hypothetical protein Q4F71_06060, partial [Paracoccus sp. (in: a-proteobacteria)]|nr:hypothetical protein [Paracoccus sp. (in: a-proteobacteria)]
QIISTGETRVAFRPWSYLAPMTLRFTALDPAAVREGEGGIKIAPLAVVERWAQTVTLEHGVNCAESAVRPPQGEWVRLPAGDPLVRAVCNGG